ncbi:transcriptional regulator [Pseudomonas stutzeri]|uniref:Positive regulator for alginate biosynthesis MucC n=1 Tax=Stutzerimonas stutzeri KOS6 TaxID=1218352 RepID=A0A061JKY4_STUST|nr:SoxR reducing system RseC family protein [Stutzerimonas stutzeri]EWC39278.1 positive regulator for alginate biosynthesis MucC [Stutzerimonas stutzeri KOS6]MBK3868116.1 transcriptional regulator [Stutzerimonas stutzeri]
MIEESGRVVALDVGAVWVETRRTSTCSGCSAKNGCGQGLMDTLGVREKRGLIRALSDLRLQVGDSVVVGIREEVLLRGAVLVYLLPLIMLMGAATVAAQFSAPEPVVILTGFGGFFVSWLVVRMRARRTAGDPSLQPVVLRAMLAGPASP